MAEAEGKANPLPNVGDLLFVGVCQLLLFMRPAFIFGDGSTGWHLATGFYILNKHVIPHQDFLSYTFPGKEWVAYEWLSDLMMAALVKVGGLNLLAVVVTLSLATLVLALYQRIRSAGSNFIFALLFSVFGLLTAAIHWLVRPHIFTFWGVYLFTTKLEDFYNGKRSLKSLFAWLLPYMILWVNCHPAFLLAFAITGLYMVVATFKGLIAGASPLRDAKLKQAGQLLALLGGLFAVSLLNPYGLQLYHYIGEYLHGTGILAQTDEFKAPNFLFNFHAWCLAVLFAFLATGLAIGAKKISLPSLAMTGVFTYLSLSAVRHMPLFVIVALPVLGVLYSGVQLSADRLPKLLNGLKALVTGAANFDSEEKNSSKHLLPILYSLIVIIIAFATPKQGPDAVLKAGFDPLIMPSKTLDYIAEKKLPASSGFNLDNWGGLISYQLEMPVFIDDRADFYGEKFYGDYGTVCEAKAGWSEILDQHKINWVLFPKDSILIKKLSERPDWSKACEDPASTLMTRVSQK
jgi:hypothetical protein